MERDHILSSRDEISAAIALFTGKTKGSSGFTWDAWYSVTKKPNHEFGTLAKLAWSLTRTTAVFTWNDLPTH